MRFVVLLAAAAAAFAQTQYDIVLKGGHVVDGKSGLSAVRDVGNIKAGLQRSLQTYPPPERAGWLMSPGCM
jgi:hypothetical protein